MSKRNQEQDYYYEDEYNEEPEENYDNNEYMYYPQQNRSWFRDILKTALIVVAILVGASILSRFILGGQDVADTKEPSSYVSNNGKPSNYKPTNSTNPRETESATTKPSQTAIQLTAGESNRYAKWITYNKGTEFEENILAYYIPSGKYTVKNTGSYPAQINVYSNTKKTTSDGYEEPGAGYSKSINVGESVSITIGNNQHIEIDALTKLSLTRTGDASGGNTNTNTSQTPDTDKETVKYEVVANYNRTVINSIGTPYIQGVVVVKNTGNTNLYLGYAQFDIEDETGKLVASRRSVDGYPQVLAPGETGVYFDEISVENLDPAKMYNIEAHLDVKKATVDLIRLQYSDIDIHDDNHQLYIYILGRVTNQTKKDYSSAKIVAICYDADGKIIAVPFTYGEFAAGETKGFQMAEHSMFGNTSADIARYEIYVYPHQYQFD